ncbi:hypothetical protein CDD80_2269 [Ophiocordyceps camponoti-rufipedis]|uniref:Uncharacterized protein n=1 Tax=Ophiocordyceps camponoti-rufipedis TaxID=2004952 RepID=A0A2C5XDD9_9HYPO|nr:hypothetical protein CDD80_2269 [Ophiocordyceps camponoti-rufipedis]
MTNLTNHHHNPHHNPHSPTHTTLALASAFLNPIPPPSSSPLLTNPGKTTQATLPPTKTSSSIPPTSSISPASKPASTQTPSSPPTRITARCTASSRARSTALPTRIRSADSRPAAEVREGTRPSRSVWIRWTMVSIWLVVVGRGGSSRVRVEERHWFMASSGAAALREMGAS